MTDTPSPLAATSDDRTPVAAVSAPYQTLTEKTQALLEGIRSWVAFETYSENGDDVNALMDHVAAGWRGAGANVDRVAGRNGFGDHLLVTSPWGADDEPGILVLCHLDTVHPRGTLDGALPFRIEGDRAYGPGIYDMKGGAYLAFHAYTEIVAEMGKTALPLRFCYTSDEEVGSETSREFIIAQSRRAKYVLVTEPARDGGKIVTGRKGVGRYTLRVEGRAAHAGSRHADGRNAILEMAQQIVAVQGMTDYERGITTNIGLVNGGTAENVVPQFCEATIDTRAETIADANDVDERLRALAPINADCTVTVAGGINRMPYEKNEGGARLLSHARQLAAEIGFTLEDMFTGGGSDGNFTAETVPTLDGLGVDGDGAHTLNEHLFISSLEPRMELQKRLMATLR
ncbi:MAG: M20 family metallopeptidase [Pseudomonadota bacterium]